MVHSTIDPKPESFTGGLSFVLRRGSMRTGVCLILVCLLVFAALPVFGSVGNGTITVTVIDPAGAVVAGAGVSAKNAETGVTYPAVSTSTGNYTIPDLPV